MVRHYTVQLVIKWTLLTNLLEPALKEDVITLCLCPWCFMYLYGLFCFVDCTLFTASWHWTRIIVIPPVNVSWPCPFLVRSVMIFTTHSVHAYTFLGTVVDWLEPVLVLESIFVYVVIYSSLGTVGANPLCGWSSSVKPPSLSPSSSFVFHTLTERKCLFSQHYIRIKVLV